MKGLTMKGLTKAAKRASGNDQTCSHCPLGRNQCSFENLRACHTQFIKGFTKGAKWFKKNLWHDADDETPRKNVPLLLFFDDETLALGIFDGKMYSFGVPEASLSKPTEILAFLYITDIL